LNELKLPLYLICSDSYVKGLPSPSPIFSHHFRAPSSLPSYFSVNKFCVSQQAYELMNFMVLQLLLRDAEAA
jgi:hypothetical protein